MLIGPWRLSTAACPTCHRNDGHRVRVLAADDGTSVEAQHQCQACGATWWVDGIDR